MGKIQRTNKQGGPSNSREDERIGNLIHKPVLLNEVLEYLDIQPGEKFVDCTVGLGGHALAIKEKGGEVLGIDRDEESLKNLKGINVKKGNFADLKELVDFSPDGILLDLGMSSWQLEKSGRGITFQKTEPLDMRMDLDNSLTAEEIVNEWPESSMNTAEKDSAGESPERLLGQGRKKELRPPMI
jgi:16S rRNA (cytosine1402-N4)-methyltransferase